MCVLPIQYKNADLARRDVTTALQHYKDLRPSLEPFVFNDGTTQHLLQLEGTVPVLYKGKISVIKAGRYVDMNGKVDMPFLREWRWPSSDLMGLIQILIVTFGEECPVFSRVPARPPPPGQPPYPTGQGPLPMPSLGGSHSQTSTPPYPAYPGSGYPQQHGFPPYPSQPGGNFAHPSGNFGYPPTSGYPPATSSYPSSQPQQYPGQYGGYGTNPPYPAPHTAFASSQGSTATSTASVRPPTGQGTVTEEHLRASLLSAVEDKMKRKLREFFAQAQAEMDVLKKTETDLTKGKEKLETMIRELEQEKAAIGSSITLLTDKDREVKDALQKMESNDKVDVDEAVVTTTPLYRQLLDAFAEEQAIEDAIYYLGEALRKNVIELEVFLKRVRELSRKQFMLRALIQKCREKAGLPPLA
ncbi:hypothetical protein BaRGS_00039261 [Batillaria attramentaria]|uniref:Tumor susceptibility gene 101 protein n=1 Tax=Batillaria attramentaria TaxID=370345 RepID=A0ABD0J3L6_9CAEN